MTYVNMSSSAVRWRWTSRPNTYLGPLPNPPSPKYNVLGAVRLAMSKISYWRG
jgi:hypothetical protein